jgi:hypothetical protein
MHNSKEFKQIIKEVAEQNKLINAIESITWSIKTIDRRMDSDECAICGLEALTRDKDGPELSSISLDLIDVDTRIELVAKQKRLLIEERSKAENDLLILRERFKKDANSNK